MSGWLSTYLDEPDRQIFQSSRPGSGLAPGAKVKESLVKQLYATDVFILLYTGPGADWEYCIWEYGVSMVPDADSAAYVIVQFNDHPKGFFDDIKIVKANDYASILDFVKQLLCNEAFIPRHEALKNGALLTSKWVEVQVGATRSYAIWAVTA